MENPSGNTRKIGNLNNHLSRALAGQTGTGCLDRDLSVESGPLRAVNATAMVHRRSHTRWRARRSPGPTDPVARRIFSITGCFKDRCVDLLLTAEVEQCSGRIPKTLLIASGAGFNWRAQSGLRRYQLMSVTAAKADTGVLPRTGDGASADRSATPNSCPLTARTAARGQPPGVRLRLTADLQGRRSTVSFWRDQR